MFESKNFTRFWNIYKPDFSDIIYQNFSCKTRYFIKKIQIEENLTTTTLWVWRGKQGLKNFVHCLRRYSVLGGLEHCVNSRSTC